MEVRTERVFFSLSPCSPHFSAAREENRNKFTWCGVAGSKHLSLGAGGVDCIAVMGFNLIGSLVGSSSATFDQLEKREPTTN